LFGVLRNSGISSQAHLPGLIQTSRSRSPKKRYTAKVEANRERLVSQRIFLNPLSNNGTGICEKTEGNTLQPPTLHFTLHSAGGSEYEYALEIS
jgi:hypothetical protein